MPSNIVRLHLLAALALLWHRTLAHTVLTYPGWRGDNLVTNGTLPQYDTHQIGVGSIDGQWTFPYGQQWIYPCGGMPMSTNRTLWPVNGGAVAFQPGWFQGHKKALIYINIGINDPGSPAPPNMSHPVVSPFQMVGPDDVQFNGTVCLPQVPLPTNVTFNIGDNVTIQVIETAQHGAAIYNCVDVTLADPADVAEVNSSNCFNSSDISFELMFTTASLSDATSAFELPSILLMAASTSVALMMFGL